MAKKLTKKEQDKLDAVTMESSKKLVVPVKPEATSLVSIKCEVENPILLSILEKEVGPIVELLHLVDKVVKTVPKDFQDQVLSDIYRVGSTFKGLEFTLHNLEAAKSYYEDMNENAEQAGLEPNTDDLNITDKLIQDLVKSRDKVLKKA